MITRLWGKYKCGERVFESYAAVSRESMFATFAIFAMFIKPLLLQ